MKRTRVATITITAAALAFGVTSAQAQSDANRKVEDGGIAVPGWKGVVDARAAQAGESVENARLAMEDGALKITTGPAITYWNPANSASGDYTVRATFREPEYMNLNDHPHPYGIVIAGNDMGTERQSYLYCAAYGNGRFIVRGFGPEPFQMGDRRPQEHPAVNKAAGRGEPVTQEIAVSVRGNEVSCAINGTTVATYDKAELVADGRLESTDGVYGIRAAHNTDVIVSGLTVTKQ